MKVVLILDVPLDKERLEKGCAKVSFEATQDQIIKEVKKALPNVQVIDAIAGVSFHYENQNKI